ncbi:MAG: DNA polymerase II large subunit [Candidatus Nanoarchaeia archaeon]|nr:DNA polymerase II large subunit [Candidatus Nanoarchaeia archaeon]
MNTQSYFRDLDSEIKKVYTISEIARAKGLDPVNKIESPLAKSMAEKVVGLISTIYPQMEGSGIAQRILELEKDFGKLDPAVAFRIAEEVSKQKFCNFATLLEAIEAGIRIGFAYITLGVVSSPIEGFTGLKLFKTKEGKDYFVAYFSGPIRSAGTTASCLALMLIDYLRELFGYAKYDPNEDEIKRYITENHDYHERITNLQYMPTDEEIEFLAKNIPIQIAGEPTEKKEVSGYKNLPRVDTNCIRGGMCLIFSEGLAQKAAKGFRLLKVIKSRGFIATGFDFLKDYVELHEKRNAIKEVKSSDDLRPVYIKDLVAGRPVFGHPSRSGGFRFRYGRGRVSGFSAASIHPATMGITDSFIATGTQLKIEKPTKGMVVTVCDNMDGPIVKLTNGSVRKIMTTSEAKKIYNEVEEIIYLGDLLFPFSDVANRNYPLIKPGYVEEWWKLELRAANPELEKKTNPFSINFDEALEISRNYGIPLNPKFILFWNQISKEEFLGLINWLKYARINRKIIFPYTKSDKEKFAQGKRALELLGAEHEVTLENVVLDKETSKVLFINLGMDLALLEQEELLLKDNISFLNLENLASNLPEKNPDILLFINEVSKPFIIKDKAGDFIGARMGRPEKAKLRKLTGSPNILFPVGKEGGRLRSMNEAVKVGSIKGEFPIFYCDKCKKETIYSICEDCKENARNMYYCRDCDEKMFIKCDKCKNSTSSNQSSDIKHNSMSYLSQSLDIQHYFQKAQEDLGLRRDELPPLIKGVRGLSSSGKQIENIAKGILRAKNNLQVNKDGTIRFDATELPLMAFKPKEIFVSVEKLKELGYDTDVYGNELVNDEQILELMPHDILLPCSSESTDERADDVFMRIAKFLDELLVKFYKQQPFYNIKNRQDLVGQLGVCMAPHNCAGVICRIIGFSNAQGLYASPYMHAAIRRDCDGDEAAIMLLLDVLLNFSRTFLPSHRGGTQDAPLVLNGRINAGEVDEQILDFEMASNFEYPLELYLAAEQRKHSSEIKFPNIKSALKEGKDPFVNLGFTHDTSNFNDGVVCSSYKFLGTMQEKVQHQMALVEKIRAADTSDTVRLIIERHFLKDLKGNLRKFSTQDFRCVACNEIVRRPPLTGRCPVCRGKLIFTVNEGGIKKYLDPALNLAEKYHLSNYLRQNLELVRRYVDSIFGKEPEKQESLKQWF